MMDVVATLDHMSAAISVTLGTPRIRTSRPLGDESSPSSQKRRLTQEEIADKIVGISLPTYRMLEAGKLTVSTGHRLIG